MPEKMLSELIKQLKEIYDEHGDLRVTSDDSYGNETTLSVYTYVDDKGNTTAVSIEADWEEADV